MEHFVSVRASNGEIVWQDRVSSANFVPRSIACAQDWLASSGYRFVCGEYIDESPVALRANIEITPCQHCPETYWLAEIVNMADNREKIVRVECDSRESALAIVRAFVGMYQRTGWHQVDEYQPGYYVLTDTSATNAREMSYHACAYRAFWR